MSFELKDFLNAVGPNASLIFASWILLSFLQTRHTGAYDRYRALIDEYRQHGSPADPHQRSVAAQVGLYKRRCEQMRRATNIGVAAAILLILSIISGGLQVVWPQAAPLKHLGAGSAIAGLVENTSIRQAIDGEVADLPELARGEPGPRPEQRQANAGAQRPASA